MATLIIRSGGKDIGTCTTIVGQLRTNGMDIWQGEAFEGHNLADSIASVTAMSESGAKKAIRIAAINVFKLRAEEQKSKQANTSHTLNYKEMKWK